MKNKLILIVAGILFPILLCAQKNDTLKQNWDKSFSSPSEIIDRYKQLQNQANPEISTRNTCFLILKSGQYISSQKGEGNGIKELLQEITLPALELPAVTRFMEEQGATPFVDYYFMIQELKNGIPFADARDGLSPSTEYPGRPLNIYDYRKLETFQGIE